jgi:hypothetical protein
MVVIMTNILEIKSMKEVIITRVVTRRVKEVMITRVARVVRNMVEVMKEKMTMRATKEVKSMAEVMIMKPASTVAMATRAARSMGEEMTTKEEKSTVVTMVVMMMTWNTAKMMKMNTVKGAMTKAKHQVESLLPEVVLAAKMER